MCENVKIPFVIRIEEPMETVNLTNIAVQFDPSNQQVYVKDNPIQLPEDTSCVFQVVYPHELNLNPVYQLKRGRPKKKKADKSQVEPQLTKESEPKTMKGSRTRSGRLVKLPKHIEKDFKKIEITADEDVQVSDFKRVDEKENSQIEFKELNQKKRVISSQYKCPKCSKAYLGKNKMIQHLTKYPDHGPFPEGYQELNFDVWNYLVDITQKSKATQRGLKFCEELSNLLHNVQLLKSALFKTDVDSKNCVNIDKVLGNAIGLPPGKYKFDENELYKDVTVLKLITSSDFFKPNTTKCADFTQSKMDDETDVILDEVTVKKIKRDPYSGKKRNNVPSGKLLEESHEFCNHNEPFTTSTPEKLDEQRHLQCPDLPTENLLLHSRNSVDELISCVDSGTNLLDNSISSDEVMNVDQFVNERFKKIIEPDLEITNLDLPTLDLFQFPNS